MHDSKRPNQKQSKVAAASVALVLANHAAMGVALGLVFALILVWTPYFGVVALINLSNDPSTSMETFLGTVTLMFGVGAALTGLILTMEDVQS